jgi:hypothetical protein
MKKTAKLFHFNEWETAALKINKNEKGYTKAPPPNFFPQRTTEEIPLIFNNKLCG